MKILTKTTRRYQNVRIDSNEDEMIGNEAVKLLKVLAPSLRELRFLNTENVVVDSVYPFPHLQKLQFINNISDVNDLLLQGSTNLTELNLKHHYWAEPEKVATCLRANKKLTMLKLWDTGISKLFDIYKPNLFKFKLKRFASGSDGDISKEAEENFFHFLDTQRESLEAIRIRAGLEEINESLVNKIFQMSTLKIIHFDAMIDGMILDFKLEMNPKLIELRLPWNIETLERLKPFLLAAPNVETLFLKKVDKEILEYIALTMKQVLTLYYTRANACIDCFKKFLRVNEDANKDLTILSKEWY